MATQPMQLRAVCTANYDYHNTDHDHDHDDGEDNSHDDSCDNNCEDNNFHNYDPQLPWYNNYDKEITAMAVMTVGTLQMYV